MCSQCSCNTYYCDHTIKHLGILHLTSICAITIKLISNGSNTAKAEEWTVTQKWSKMKHEEFLHLEKMRIPDKNKKKWQTSYSSQIANTLLSNLTYIQNTSASV